MYQCIEIISESFYFAQSNVYVADHSIQDKDSEFIISVQIENHLRQCKTHG